MMKDKIIPIAVGLALVFSLFAFFRNPASPLGPPQKVTTRNLGAVGAIGNMLAEQYMPYVLYNQGYNTAVDITGTGNNTFSSTTATTLKVGQVGTALTRKNVGTCNLNFGNVPVAITASTTTTVDCQTSNMLSTATIAQAVLAGVSTGDRVFITLATTTPANNGTGIIVIGANASSTNGYITVKLGNFTGANFTPGTTTTAGVQYTSEI